METKHLRGLSQDFNRGLKEARKMGGASDALKRAKKRPGGTYNIRKTIREGYVVMDGRGLVICVKCGEKKLRGYLISSLCEECYEN